MPASTEPRGGNDVDDLQFRDIADGICLTAHGAVGRDVAAARQPHDDGIAFTILRVGNQVLEFLGQQQLVRQTRRNVEIGDLLQRSGAFLDTSFEVFICLAQSHVRMPLGAQGRRQLPALGAVEGFLEQEHLVGRRNLPAQDIGIQAKGTRHHDDVDIGVELANALCRPDAVDAGRHMHVDERDGVRLAALQCRGHGIHGALPLVTRVHLEAGREFLVGFLAQQHLLEVAERGCDVIRLEIFAEAAQELADNMRIVVDDEHTIDERCGLQV